MNKILYFVGGLALGGSLGYIFTRKALDKHYDEMLETENNELREYHDKKINELQEYYDKKINELREYYDKKLEEIAPTEIVFDRPSAPDPQKEGVSIQNEPKNRGKRVNYTSYFDPDDAEIDGWSDPGGPTEDDPEEEIESSEYRDETEEISCVRMSKTGIELISAIDYNERNGYEKDEYFYYKKTKTLADSNDEIVDCYEDVVGTEFEDIIFQGNAGTIYVRNNGFAKDFLITVLNERYDFSRL
jgi:hypothetical protein